MGIIRRVAIHDPAHTWAGHRRGACRANAHIAAAALSPQYRAAARQAPVRLTTVVSVSVCLGEVKWLKPDRCCSMYRVLDVPRMQAYLRDCLKSLEMSVFDRCRATPEGASIALSPLKSVMPICTWTLFHAATETFQTASKGYHYALCAALYLLQCDVWLGHTRSHR